MDEWPHDHPRLPSCSLGIPRPGRFDPVAFERAVTELLQACGIEALVTFGRAAGAACVVEAEQLCLLLGEDRRGDERVVTQAFTGTFETSEQARAEFRTAVRLA